MPTPPASVVVVGLSLARPPCTGLALLTKALMLASSAMIAEDYAFETQRPVNDNMRAFSVWRMLFRSFVTSTEDDMPTHHMSFFCESEEPTENQDCADIHNSSCAPRGDSQVLSQRGTHSLGTASKLSHPRSEARRHRPRQPMAEGALNEHGISSTFTSHDNVCVCISTSGRSMSNLSLGALRTLCSVSGHCVALRDVLSCLQHARFELSVPALLLARCRGLVGLLLSIRCRQRMRRSCRIAQNRPACMLHVRSPVWFVLHHFDCEYG